MWKNQQPVHHRQQVNWVISTLHDHMQQFGYEITDLPIIVDADMFLIKAGDQIINHLFTFERNGRQLALRPEFTAAAVHRYITSSHRASIARWQFSGDVFIDNPLETNPDYQHLAIGAEIIGMHQGLAEAEVIAMSAHGLSALGVDEWEISIGHAGLIPRVLAQFNLDSITQRLLLHHLPALRNPDLGKTYVMDAIDKRLFTQSPNHLAESENEWIINLAQMGTMSSVYLPASGSRTSSDIARRLWEKRKRIEDRPLIMQVLDFLDEWCKVDGSQDEVFAELIQILPHNSLSLIDTINQWRFVLDTLSGHEVPASQIRIKPDLARNWEYYTGIVFDLHVNGIHVGGGGRYDEFARLIGSKTDVPAVGFTYYCDALLSVIPPRHSQATLISIHVNFDQSLVNAVRLAKVLRNFGFAAQILPKYASFDETAAIILGDDESIRFHQRTYMPSEIKKLVADLRL